MRNQITFKQAHKAISSRTLNQGSVFTQVCQCQQDGYSLLLSLFLLLGIGSAWFAIGSHLSVKNHYRQTLALEQARIALISYAVNYIDHYGAQGAGVGHFPCPDTDQANIKHKDPWHLDGPNPPCSQHDILTGWLPRHVSVEAGRYHFHARQQQRLRYAVSSRFINNPTNRIVNPSVSTGISIDQFDDVIAILVAPALDTSRSNDSASWHITNLSANHAYTLIRISDVLPAALVRVGAWLAESLNTALGLNCPNDGLEIPCDSQFEPIQYCGLSNDAMLLYWLDRQMLAYFCANADDLEPNTMRVEAVSAKQHWFIRNQWSQHVELTVDDACGGSNRARCKFSLGSIQRTADLIPLHFMPITAL